MTADQFRTLIAKHGLTQQAVARLLGVTGRTPQRWAADGVTGSAAVLFTLLRQGKITIEDIERAAGK